MACTVLIFGAEKSGLRRYSNSHSMAGSSSQLQIYRLERKCNAEIEFLGEGCGWAAQRIVPGYGNLQSQCCFHKPLISRFMAGTTGLEPATSAVTGQRSNQLSYVPSFLFFDLR